MNLCTKNGGLEQCVSEAMPQNEKDEIFDILLASLPEMIHRISVLFCWPKYFFLIYFFFWKLALTLCSVCIIVSIKMYSQGEHLIFSIIMSMSCLDNKKGKEDWLLRLKASEKKWRRNDKIIILGHTVIQKKWELSKDIIERWCRNKGNSSSF